MLLPCLVFGGLGGLFAFRGKADASGAGVQILYSKGDGVALVQFAVLVALLGILDDSSGQQTGDRTTIMNETLISAISYLYENMTDPIDAETLTKELYTSENILRVQFKNRLNSSYKHPRWEALLKLKK